MDRKLGYAKFTYPNLDDSRFERGSRDDGIQSTVNNVIKSKIDGIN